MFDVLCLSDCCCDLVFEGLERIPAPGTEEYCRQLHMKAGGGANTPMGLAKLGCATAYLTSLGCDPMGALVMEELRRAGVAADYIQQVPDAATWVSAVLSTPEDRAFASFAGRDMTCTRQELERIVSSVRWVHTYTVYCEKYPFLPEVCRQAGVTLSLDATFGDGKTLRDLAGVLSGAGLFTPNETEALALTGEKDPRAALEALAGLCDNVVITMGEKGCIAALDGGRYRVEPPRVPFADANGAGDLFDAGLIAARLAGLDAPGQLRCAAASGALAVTYPGGMDDVYTKKAVEELTRSCAVTLL